MFVRTWMSAPAVVIPPVVPVDAALEFMMKRGIRRLPVVEDGRLLGIVTRSDLEAEIGRGHAPRRRGERTVSDVMARSPLTVDPDETLEHAAKVMLEKKVSGLPVVDGGKVVGIITESDLFRALCLMMGIAERGARVIMTVPEDQDVLGTIRKRLNGLSMRSLVTVHDPKRNCWDVLLRVRGRAAMKQAT